jgi:hypothetical protein
MYGDTGTGLGRNDRDRPTLKSRENLLYVSAEDLYGHNGNTKVMRLMFSAL